MSNLLSVVVLGIALMLPAQAALACGFCIEDKIAAVYDHRVVMQALAQKHHLAFFGLDGRLAGSAAEARNLERIVATAFGVDPGSVRVSVESAALSVAFDPAAVPFGTLNRSVQKKLAPRGLALLPLRVMDRPGELKTAARP